MLNFCLGSDAHISPLPHLPEVVMNLIRRLPADTPTFREIKGSDCACGRRTGQTQRSAGHYARQHNAFQDSHATHSRKWRAMIALGIGVGAAAALALPTPAAAQDARRRSGQDRGDRAGRSTMVHREYFYAGNKIGRITTAGEVVTEYPLPTAQSETPRELQTGPDLVRCGSLSSITTRSAGSRLPCRYRICYPHSR